MIEGTWLNFVELMPKPKTKVWEIQPKDNSPAVGVIQWQPQWRCYAFYPAFDTVFEPICLREIAVFCGERTKEHKLAMKQTGGCSLEGKEAGNATGN